MLNFKNTTIAYIAILLLLMVGSLFFYFSGWVFFYVIISYLIIIIFGSFWMKFRFFVPTFTANKITNKPYVALTFDDGPHPVYTEQVLLLLRKYQIRATFFCIGKNIERYPDIFKKIVEEGHTIGNHSYSHKNTIGFNGTKCWINELEQTDTLIESFGVKKPAYFRPPFGVTSPHLAKAISFTSHTVIGWSIRPYDTSIKHKWAILRHIKRKLKPGSVVLLHDTHARIPFILERLLLFLHENNYKAVTINRLLDEK
ncbi:MAG: polysaccharide deacetylase [Flavobacteriaceae bacterium]|nr:polysaccharide deacetylase [Flavobacteriaceae bacterium]|tara:strand:+ start:74289 stop:75056 length:768 start_codon:yes stop_codon:yes gene_type:complete